ncbi:hypothetical protein ACWV95_09780 [Streptomyces albus]
MRSRTSLVLTGRCGSRVPLTRIVSPRTPSEPTPASDSANEAPRSEKEPSSSKARSWMISGTSSTP